MNQIIKRSLHIAPQNISDVPMTLVRAERSLGTESRLVTFFPDPRGYDEDICLHLPGVSSSLARQAKTWFSDPERLRVRNVSVQPAASAPIWQPHSRAESMLVRLREKLWAPKIKRLMRRIDFWNFDVYFFEAGLGFFRDGRVVRQLKARGKTVLVAYTGSDFRTRGIIQPVHDAADVRITFEWDHLDLDPGLRHVLFPFEPERFRYRERPAAGRIRIGHAPTHRAAKGSEQIIAAVQALAARYGIDLVLIENRPHREALVMKDRCDIFIDQIGDLGYGINALEAIAMGIPTCTSLVPRFVQAYAGHPFVEIDATNLQERIIELIEKPEQRVQRARQGRAWVEAHHDSRQIIRTIYGFINRESLICK